MRTLLISFCVLLLNGCALQAQRGGNITHTVQQGETLYALSKHYAVPVVELVAANPGSELGLKIGQQLAIPLHKADRKERKNAPDLVDGELLHTAKKKETLYGIARKYKVDVNDVLERNPELASGLSEGARVVIPVAKARLTNPVLLMQASSEEQRMHTVQPGETLYSISRMYEVSVDDIRNANGGLPVGLKAGSAIRVPEVKKEEEVVLETEADRVDKRAEYNVCMMLPFELDDAAIEDEIDGLTEIALHFYFGAQMALDTLKEQGIRADVHVFDVDTSDAKLKDVLREEAVKNSDLFIGPFHRSPLEMVAAVAATRNVHVVCPVPQNNKVLLGRPHLSKVVSGRSAQVKGIAKYVQQNFAREKVVLVKPAKWTEEDLQGQMERALRNALPEKEIDIAKFETTTDEIQAAMVLNGKNIIVVPSEDPGIVSDLITKLNALPESYEIVLFGMSKWVDLHNVDPIYKEKFNLHIPANSYIDRNDRQVVSFIQAFRERHGAEPSSFAFMGYDVMLHYLTALYDQGRNFEDRFDQVRSHPLHTGFQMVRTGLENGFRNDHVVILNYRNFRLYPVELW